MYPSIEINLRKIKENASLLLKLCRSSGIEPCAVTKAVCGSLPVAEALVEAGFKQLADSRLENLAGLRKRFAHSVELVLLRLPMLSQCSTVPLFCDISLNSELSTLAMMENYVRESSASHRVILMVDLGDLREGFWPDEMAFVHEAISGFTALKVEGLGVNLTCYGGVIPDQANLSRLVGLKKAWEQQGGQLKTLSGGNSSTVRLLLEKKVPAEINHLRLGESILLGRETIDREAIPGAHLDAFTIRAEVIELKEKPSLPLGTVSQDAFGQTPCFIDRGVHRRAILAVGRQDIDLPLESLHSRLEILGASSDHLIADAVGCPGLKVGDLVEFIPGYGALLKAMTSPYVRKEYVE